MIGAGILDGGISRAPSRAGLWHAPSPMQGNSFLHIELLDILVKVSFVSRHTSPKIELNAKSVTLKTGDQVPRILLAATNWWPHSARLAIALSEAGCEVQAVFPRGNPLSKLAFVRAFTYSPWRSLQSLHSSIVASAPSVVIPCDDRAARHLYELHGQASAEKDSELADLIENSMGPASAYPVLNSRYEILKVAREAGISTPEMSLIQTDADIDSWCARQEGPWVLKADGTSGGFGVKILHSETAARKVAAAMRRPMNVMVALKRAAIDRDCFVAEDLAPRFHPAVIAQAYVTGRPANIAVFAFQGEVLAAISVEVAVAYSETGAATVVRVVESPAMLQAAKALVKRLSLSGFCGLDFMIERNSDVPLLVEVNARVTPQCHIRLGNGRDLVNALCMVLTGRMGPLKCVTRTGIIAYFPQAWDCNSWSEFLHNAYHDVPWEEPALVRELLNPPWATRSRRARLANKIRTLFGGNDTVQPLVFPEAFDLEPVRTIKTG
jgi:hypothetical protein